MDDADRVRLVLPVEVRLRLADAARHADAGARAAFVTRRRDILAAMSGQPPQLRDQAGVRSGLRIGGAILAAIGLILIIVGVASFFSTFGSFGSSSMSPPKHFWMLFAGLPLLFVGVAMLGWGFLGTTTRYAAGEVAPTVKDTLGYVGFGAGAQEVTCAKCGGTNRAGAKFCEHCGAALSVSCPSCGHANPADAAFCAECGKPLTPA